MTVGLFSVSNKFGALLSRLQGHLIGPSRASDLSNVLLDNGSIQPANDVGTVVTTGAGTLRSIYKAGSVWSLSTTAYQYVEFGGFLIRVASGAASQISADNGTTWYNLGITAPSSAPTIGYGAGALTGTYYYYVTFVSALGGESAPSPISAAATPVAQGVALTNIPTGASGDNVTSRRIYRVGGTLTTINLVGTIADNVTTTLTDAVSDATAATGAVLSSTTYTPPGQLEWIAVSPYGILFGGIGARVYYSVAALPRAWPTANYVDLPEATVAGAYYAGAMTVLTGAQPYVINGNSTSTFSVIGIPAQQGCVARDSLVDMGHSLFYRSNDGICRFTGRDVEVISKESLADALLDGASATNCKAARYNERYLIFFQSGTSFPSGGYVEWNPRVDGEWLKGTTPANAVHYNRTADALYVAQTSDVRQWEAGATLAGYYVTGDWIDRTYSLLKHWTIVAVDHTGTIAVDVIIDGTTVVTGRSCVQGSSVGRSRFYLPPGRKGRAISFKVSWAAGASVRVVEVMDNIARKAQRL